MEHFQHTGTTSGTPKRFRSFSPLRNNSDALEHFQYFLFLSSLRNYSDSPEHLPALRNTSGVSLLILLRSDTSLSVSHFKHVALRSGIVTDMIKTFSTNGHQRGLDTHNGPCASTKIITLNLKRHTLIPLFSILGSSKVRSSVSYT